MGTAVAQRATTAVKLKPIAEVVIQMRGHIYDAKGLATRANNHQLQAGQKLLHLRRRIEAGEEGEVEWWDWFEANMEENRKTCEKLMKIAGAEDPEAALLEQREQERVATTKHREKKALEMTVIFQARA